MGVTLAEVVSKSNPSQKYEIKMGKDGKVYCTCPRWKYKRTCKHLDEFFKMVHKKGAEMVQDGIKQALKARPTPVGDPDLSIEIAVGEAVELLKQR